MTATPISFQLDHDKADPEADIRLVVCDKVPALYRLLIGDSDWQREINIWPGFSWTPATRRPRRRTSNDPHDYTPF
jgi:hypothetical protein